MTDCPHCHAKLSRPGALFCPICGQAIQGAAAPPAQGGPHLIITELNQPSRQVPLTKPMITLGRETDNDIRVQNPAVSRHHLRFERKGADYWLTDLGSTNGTLVNGKAVQSQLLPSGAIIRIGDQQGNWVGLTFHSTHTPHPRSATIHLGDLPLQQAALISIGREPSCDIHLDHPSISHKHAQVERSGSGHLIRDLHSRNGTFVNGRALRGAQALQTGDVIHIGPFKLVYDPVSGLSQFTSAGNYRLDGIRLSREVPESRIPWYKRLLLRLQNKVVTKRILNDISLSIAPREFVAVVGGSGAGKSTLMKALSGLAPAEGQVLLNGDDLYKNFAAYRSILGYVPQDDIIHTLLTVDSALTYAGQLRLPDATSKEIRQRVAEVLAQVELTEHAHKQVKNLSGGQRKRVSIAVELLAAPGLFFLDEPTSGLDPGIEKKMMYTMRQLADAGQTVVLVTHATANISQCTHVAFVAGGYLVYFGPPPEALTFFGASDFADIYTRLSQGVDPNKHPLPPPLRPYYQATLAAGNPQPTAPELWAACFQHSPIHQQYIENRLQAAGNGGQGGVGSQRSRQRVSPFQQFGVVGRRYFDLIRRDTLRLAFLLLIMPVIGLLLLLTLPQDKYIEDVGDIVLRQISLETRRERIQEEITDPTKSSEGGQRQGRFEMVGPAQRLLFMMALAVNLLGTFAAAYEIVQEEPIYSRERMVNLQILPYILSKVAVLGLFALLQCLLLLLVVGSEVRYPAQGVLLTGALEMYVTLFLATLASICLGLFVSALLRSTDSVIYVILLLLFAQILFAGAIFELDGVAGLLSRATTTRWTLEALGSTVDMEALKAQSDLCIEFDEEALGTLMRREPPCEQGQMRQASAYKFNVDYRHTAWHLLSRWLALVGFSVLFCALTYRVQKRKDII